MKKKYEYKHKYTNCQIYTIKSKGLGNFILTKKGKSLEINYLLKPLSSQNLKSKATCDGLLALFLIQICQFSHGSN